MLRRDFIHFFGTGTALMLGGAFPLKSLAGENYRTLTVLHTNDFHSRIEPFPLDGGSFQGQGGAANRAALIKNIRKEAEHVLLLDAGDIFQGTPYFNYFGGELEFKLMSEMGYDAATIGNHDFDAGIDGFEKQLNHANFPFVICNYDFTETILDGKTSKYKVFNKGGIKIGITGVGIELNGLVPKSLYKETRYLDPIKEVNKVAKHLREEEKCHYIICLSHLGYEHHTLKVSDILLAKNTENVDLIIGGHTHTFLEKAVQVKNKSGRDVTINQVGWAGVRLGRLDVVFEKNFKRKCISCKNLVVQ